jgi:hypothetical protein
MHFILAIFEAPPVVSTGGTSLKQNCAMARPCFWQSKN